MENNIYKLEKLIILFFHFVLYFVFSPLFLFKWGYKIGNNIDRGRNRGGHGE